jgi:hypothetical protein
MTKIKSLYFGSRNPAVDETHIKGHRVHRSIKNRHSKSKNFKSLVYKKKLKELEKVKQLKITI